MQSAMDFLTFQKADAWACKQDEARGKPWPGLVDLLSVSQVLHGRELVAEYLSDHNRNQRSTPPKPADNPSVLQQGDEASCWTASTE
mmetsp:Transcript_32991/g.51453  ORF Transcript_32991/g.51453 Transcript_32991/m.51453 type:complete len:87 (+) Transcript_32991:524-784(+)